MANLSSEFSLDGNFPPKVGTFWRVSLPEYTKEMKLQFGEQFSDEQIKDIYDSIKLPKRATAGSAGYDFYAPFYFFVPSWGDITIPTGIKVQIQTGWFLSFYPRSGSGMKHYLRLANSIGVVDSDFYDNPSNEGHIMVKVRKESGPRDTNTPTRDVEFKAGDAFCQAIFIPFGITTDDDADGVRVGGIGSTG